MMSNFSLTGFLTSVLRALVSMILYILCYISRILYVLLNNLEYFSNYND